MNKIRIKTIINDKKLISDLRDKLDKSFEVDVVSDSDGRSSDVIITDSLNIIDIDVELADKVILLSCNPDEYNIVHYLHSRRYDHIIGMNSADVLSELVLTVEKIARKNFWGVEGYLKDIDVIKNLSITSSTGFQKEVNELVESIEYTDFFDSPKEHIKIMANELITNALYNAVMDENGRQVFADQDRKIPVTSNKGVEFKLGMDSTCVALSVADNFGTLKRDDIIDNLYRSFSTRTFQEKKGGAGLGLFMVFSNANRFIVNSDLGKRTEIICIIDKNKRYKNYKSRITSFHFYGEKG